jgi:hypothetical protein
VVESRYSGKTLRDIPAVLVLHRAQAALKWGYRKLTDTLQVGVPIGLPGRLELRRPSERGERNPEKDDSHRESLPARQRECP